MGNFIAFFRLARKATYLQACLMHAHFAKVELLPAKDASSGIILVKIMAPKIANIYSFPLCGNKVAFIIIKIKTLILLITIQVLLKLLLQLLGPCFCFS